MTWQPWNNCVADVKEGAAILLSFGRTQFESRPGREENRSLESFSDVQKDNVLEVLKCWDFRLELGGKQMSQQLTMQESGPPAEKACQSRRLPTANHAFDGCAFLKQKLESAITVNLSALLGNIVRREQGQSGVHDYRREN